MDTTLKPHQSSQSTIQTHTLKRATSIQFPMHQPRECGPLSFHAPSTVSHSVVSGTRRSTTGANSQMPKDEFVNVQRRFTDCSNSTTREPFPSPLPRSYTNDSKDTELLFLHSYCKIISFATPLVSPNSVEQLLPFSNSTDWTMSSGPLKIYRAKPHNIAFIQSGKIIHPVMAKSQCWCVEEVVGRGIWGRGRGRGVFILRIRPGVYWRVEVKEGGLTGVVDELKDLFRCILAFEKEECPFIRVGVTFVGDHGNEGIEQGTGVNNKKVQRLPVADRSSSLKPRIVSPYCDRLNSSKGFSRGYPPHTPSSSANTPHFLESFDEILSRPTPPVQSGNSLSVFGNLGHSIIPATGKQGEIWESTRTLVSLSTKSSCDSLALSLSTWSDSASTSLSSSPPMCESLAKPPLRSRGSSVRSPTYAQPWKISPPTCSTITQTTTTQTLFTTSYTDEPTTYLQGVVSQPSSLLHAAADLAIFKPGAYVVSAMLIVARSVIGGASAGKIERMQTRGGDTDGDYKVECA